MTRVRRSPSALRLARSSSVNAGGAGLSVMLFLRRRQQAAENRLRPIAAIGLAEALERLGMRRTHRRFARILHRAGGNAGGIQGAQRRRQIAIGENAGNVEDLAGLEAALRAFATSGGLIGQREGPGSARRGLRHSL